MIDVSRILSKEKLTLFVIFLIALFLRVYNLGDLPDGFYVEEMTNTYVGRFILLHGMDLYGNFSPLLYFDKFGDYAPVIPLYFSGIGTFIFGVNVFGGRFPIALIGALSIFPVFYLGKLIFKDHKIGLFSALLLAILPWHVVLSRTTSEGVIGFLFFSLGLLFVFLGIIHKTYKAIYLSLFFFLVTYFLYPSLRLLVPLAFLPLPFFYSFKKRGYKTLFVIAAIFFTGLTFAISLTDWGKGRFEQTSLFHSEEIRTSVEARSTALSNDEGPSDVFLARTFHNKIVGYFREFLNQYLSYFSPKYLFQEAGGQYRYYNVPEQGLLYVTLLPLFLFAFLPTRKNINNRFFAYVLYLLVIAPIPAALTIDFPPHVHRSMFMILPLVLLASYGMLKIQEFRYRKIIYFAFFIFLILEVVYFWHQYTRHSNSFQSRLRNDGDKTLSLYLKENKNNYDKVIMPVLERLPVYYLFFTNNFDKSFAGKFRLELRIDNIENIEFVEDWCPSKILELDRLSKKTLIVDNGDCEDKLGLEQVKLIVRHDSTKAYKLLVPSK